jgi:hypothetical protein
MKKIRRADGNTGCTRLDERKPGMIIHGLVGQKYFLAAASAHIQSGEIIQSTSGGNSSE